MTTATNWCFWSTRDSVNHDIISVTAVIETIIAVPLYWWVSIQFETYLFLLISTAIAPLVLLRSTQSIALGADWFMDWEDAFLGGTAARPENGQRLALLALGSTLSTGTVYIYFVAIGPYISNVNGLNTFSAAFLLGWASNIISVAVARIVLTRGAATERLLPASLSSTFTTLVLAYSLLDDTSFGMIFGTTAIPALLLLPVIFRTASDRLRTKNKQLYKLIHESHTPIRQTETRDLVDHAEKLPLYSIFLLPIFAPIVLLAMLGLLGFSIAIRMAATIKYLYAGFRELPQNFRRLSLCTSPLQVPEIIPGLESRNSDFDFLAVIKTTKELMQVKDLKIAMMALLVGPLMASVFVPAWIYRLTIKSTAWFWWPLAFLGAELRYTKHPELLKQKVMETLWAKASLALAFATLLGFATTTYIANEISGERNPFLSTLVFLFYVDWSLRPWQLLAVGAAGISVMTLFIVDSTSREYRYAVSEDDASLMKSVRKKLGWVERAVRLRLVLVICLWVLVGFHAVLYANSEECWFSVRRNVAVWAAAIYRDNTPPLHCAPDRQGLSRMRALSAS